MSNKFRTPRSQISYFGSAGSGTSHFWRQRVTAIANIILIPMVIVVVLASLGHGYGGAMAVLGHPISKTILILFSINMAYHMKLGMAVIIEDYVHDPFMKTASTLLNIFFSTAVGAVAVVSAFSFLR